MPSKKRILTVEIDGKPRHLRMSLAGYMAASVDPMRLGEEIPNLGAERAGKLLHATLQDKQQGETLDWLMDVCDEFVLKEFLEQFQRAYEESAEPPQDPATPKTSQA